MLRRLKRRQRYECCGADTDLITEVHTVNDDKCTPERLPHNPVSKYIRSGI